MKEEIIAAAERPRELESMYRADPRAVSQMVPHAFAELPDSAVFQVWNERLCYDAEPEEPNEQETLSRWKSGDVWLVVVLSLIAGSLVKLPIWFPKIDGNFFYPRYIGSIAAGALIFYFLIQKSCRKKPLVAATSVFAATLLFVSFLPDKNSDSITLSLIHAPFIYWSLLGIMFTGGLWRDSNRRMNFIRYCGEVVIYTTVIQIGGMVLTGLTFALFELINVSIEEWYLKNIVVYGAVASPIVATLVIDKIVGTRFRIAPMLANIFTPLFLITVVAYLGAMLIQHKSPYTDRDFLIAFNGLLLVVLALCVFSISERGRKNKAGISDGMNIALVLVTLAIDIVALTAIVFRLSEYGFTPNRLAVLGANLLTFCHLTGIVFHYFRFTGNRASIQPLEKWIVGYIPAYTCWTIIVTFGFPLFFWFA